MKCAVGKCKQSNSKKTNVSFYNFPKNAAQRQLWVKFCNRYKPIDVRKDKICSLHFKEEDFERNLIFEMGFSNRRAPKLKPGAVPTIDSTIDNEIEIPTQFDNEIEIPTQFEIKNEIPTQFEIENEIPTQFEINNEIPTQFEIKNEIPTQFEIENEIPTQFEINNEIPTQFEIKIEIPNQMDIPNTPMTTDIKEDSREQYIKTLEMQIDALRQENVILKTAQSQSAITIKNLSCKVQSLSFANLNFEKALRSLFTKDQIKKLKRGDKKQNFTGADSTSAKAYKLLRKKHFPLPSVRTLQRWSVILGPVVKILYAANQMSETTKLRVLSFDEMKAKKKSCYDKPTYFMLVPANYIQLYNYFIILAFPLQPGQKIFFTRQKLPAISHITPVNKNVDRNYK